MGIISSAVVCLRTKLVETMPTEISDFLHDLRSEELNEEEGRLYHFSHIKWYCEEQGTEPFALYEWLRTQDENDFLVVTVCHDYPENDDRGIGEWTENPWNVCRIVETYIDFDGRDSSD